MTDRERLKELCGAFPVWHKTLKEQWVPRAIERLADYLIANGATVQEWISVKDKQPEKEGSYLVYSSKSKTVFTAHYRPQIDRWANRANGQFITHWMPLPQPPKG